MKRGFQATFIAWRFYLLLIFILLIVSGLVTRLVDLTIFKRDFLQEQGNARAVRIVNTPTIRGMITDREGYPLAISASVYSIWANPKEFSASEQQLKTLSQLLGLKENAIQTIVLHAKNKNREFVYIKRDTSPEIAKKIKLLGIAGIHQQHDYKRFYPEGEVGAHIVGFTNIDEKGQEGLELAYDKWLTGMPGKKIVVKDRLGRIISDKQILQRQLPGNNLTLSINRRIQFLAYRELMEGVKRNEASSGSVVVLDTKTGEVLAMVNQPSFNPNSRINTNKEALRNRAITDLFEPGSTIKAFTVASALDSGLFKADSIIDTYPGWMRVGHNLVKDEHSKGPMTITQILQLSSNVGVTKMVLALPPNQLWGLLNRLGFGEETGVNFPGERSGSLTKREKWAPFTLATLAFGYGISVTALQLAQAYATLANRGVQVPVSLIKLNQPPSGKQVVKPAVANQMLTLLESVVEKGGTGQLAKIVGFRVAGKTGTAKLVGPNGYEKHRYMSSFVGIAPVSNPRLVVLVVIHDPQGKKFLGGQVSGPVFKNIMQGALRILNIPPDNMVLEKPVGNV